VATTQPILNITGVNTSNNGITLSLNPTSNSTANGLSIVMVDSSGSALIAAQNSNTTGNVATFINQGYGYTGFFDTDDEATSIEVDSESSTTTVVNVVGASTTGDGVVLTFASMTNGKAFKIVVDSNTMTATGKAILVEDDGGQDKFYVSDEGDVYAEGEFIGAQFMKLGIEGVASGDIYSDSSLYIRVDADNDSAGSLFITRDGYTNIATFSDTPAITFHADFTCEEDTEHVGEHELYGELFNINNSTSQPITTLGQWYQVDFASAGISRGTTPSAATDDITISTAGVYAILASVAFSGTANTVYELAVKKNNGATEFECLYSKRKLNANGDVGSVSISGICELVDTDTVELWVRNTTGNNKTFEPVHANLTVLKK
jgi:hypothetical protein